MQKISFFKKYKVRFALHKIKKGLGISPKNYFVFSPPLLFFDLLDSLHGTINESLLKKAIYQIEKHLGIHLNTNKLNINICMDHWNPYSNGTKPISITDDRLCINLAFLRVNSKNSFFNIDESNFIAILCKEITRCYLAKNNIHLKSEFYVEMAMCLLGICKEAHLLETVGTHYWQNDILKAQSFFVASRQELFYAQEFCQKHYG